MVCKSPNKTKKLRLCSFVFEGMRDRMERFAVLPFGIGCASQTSVAIGAAASADHKQRKPKAPPPHTANDPKAQGEKMKNGTFHFLTLKRTQISSGMQRLIRSIKSLSQIFVYKEEIEEEEEEGEMEIGLPTDVKHVTHIGLDGSATTNTTANPLKASSWENNFNTPEILSFPSISLKQFELAMAAQTTHQPQQQQQQLVVDLKTLEDPKDLS
ncbi:hypothetical protein ACFX2I_031661 [Malus domestica]|uniref:CRIB domain-containing protein RIC4-like n=1 Tax=Malus domestica TaxID=3750 RepID=UPI0004990498|nr:CRIB domain-containing protein RIC4-like isoform X1 [Malus domestica]